MIDSYKKLMIVSPHPDDEILGCGGLLHKFSKIKGCKINILIVSGHLPPLYSKKEFEITKKECIKAINSISKNINVIFTSLPATFIKDIATNEINSIIDKPIKKFKPDILCIPFPDRHIDHKIIFDSCMVASRPHLNDAPRMLISYETLSETHWNAPYIEPNFCPELFINIDNEIEKKCKSLSHYKSQINNNGPRSIKAIKALAAFRGSQNGCKFAEGYKVIRILS